MASIFPKYKEIQEYARAIKPNGYPPKAPKGVPTIVHSIGRSGSSTSPPHGNLKIHLDLGFPKTNSKVHCNQHSEWKQAFSNQHEKSPVNGIKKRNHIRFETSSSSKDSDLDLALTLAQPGTSIKKQPFKKYEYPSAPSQISCVSKEPNPSPITIDIRADGEPKLICMGCRSCYIYVMVSEHDPKCPRCHKSNFLLDVFREPPVKNSRMKNSSMIWYF